MPLPIEAKCELYDPVYTNLISEYFHETYYPQKGDFVISKPTKDRVVDSVLKMDKEPCYDFLNESNSPYFEKAYSLFLEGYDDVFRSPSSSINTVLSEMNFDTATGVVMRDLGIKKKTEFFGTPECVVSLYSETITESLPIWTVSPKVEKLTSVEYIENKKIRTFIIEPVESVFWRKVYFGGQNIAMKEFWHSAYGFNPYHGGVQRYARELLRHKRFWMFDGKRWDRLASWMRHVWQARTQYMTQNPIVQWLVDGILKQILLTPWGDVLIRDYGNPSGSGTTTTDNILGMTLVTLYCLVIAAKGDVAAVTNNTWFRCFGDDNHGSDSLSCSDDELRNAFVLGFSHFGVELDPLIISNELTDLEFLGFKYLEVFPGQYIPQYPRDKLLTTFFHDLHTLDPEQSLQKLLSTLLMSGGQGREFFDDLACEIKSIASSLQFKRKLNFLSSIPTYDQVIAWYLGYEGCYGFDSFFNFFYESSEVGKEQKPDMERATKAERNFKAACERMGISPQGKDWLELALDPFNDIPRSNAGYPDKIMTPSVVQRIHMTQNISGLGAGITWDACIFLDQYYKKQDLFTTTTAAGNKYQRAGQGVTAKPRGGVVVRQAASGTSLNASTTTGATSFPEDVFDNADCRVIGLGLEIHNTTAELYKQGALITWRMPDGPVDHPTTVIQDTATACVPQAIECSIAVRPPITATEAIDLPGSLQWEAAQGAYVVPVFISDENPPSFFHLKAISCEGNFPLISSTGAANSIAVTLSDGENYELPTSLSGVYLTGLSPETTLTVNVVLYVEVFPEKDNVLRRSARPSPAEDYKAIWLYTNIARSLPTGVPVDQNFLGAFISGVANLARAAVPYLPTIAASLGSFFSSSSSVEKKEKEVEKKEIALLKRELAVERAKHQLSNKPEKIAVKQNNKPPSKPKRSQKKNVVVQANNKSKTGNNWISKSEMK